MPECDPLFDGGRDPEIDHLHALMEPLRADPELPSLPRRGSRRAVWAAAAALLLFGGVGVVSVLLESTPSTSDGPGPADVGTAPVDPVPAKAGEGRRLRGGSDADDGEASVPRRGAVGERGDGMAPRAARSELRDTTREPREVVWASAAATPIGAEHRGTALHPQVAPAGDRLAYEVNYPEEKRTELWLVGWDGRGTLGEPTRLLPERARASSRFGRGKRIVHEFAWAHTGDFGYAYTISDASGNQDIYIDNWSQMISTPGSANKNATWDPNSSRFVFSSGRSGNGDLYLWDAGTELQLTFDENHGELYPTFDNSGKKVAFVRAGKGGSHIYVLDVDLFSAVPLVQFDGADSTRPVFSPDGRTVAFFSNHGHRSVLDFSLWVAPSRPGGESRRVGDLVRLPSKGGAAWTPDGKGLIAVKNDPDNGDPLCIFPINDGPVTCFETGTRGNADPELVVVDDAWRVVFVAPDAGGGHRRLWVFDVPR